MKANFTVETYGEGCFIQVINFHALNKVGNFRFSMLECVGKNAVGFWKPKTKKL